MHVFIESAQRTPPRQAVSATPKRCAHHVCHPWLIPQCSVLYSTLSIGIFKSATFGERIRRVSVLLSRPFLTRFPRTRCHIKEYSLGNKMYVSDLFTVVVYICTRLVLKNAKELFVPSVYSCVCTLHIYSCKLKNLVCFSPGKHKICRYPWLFYIHSQSGIKFS